MNLDWLFGISSALAEGEEVVNEVVETVATEGGALVTATPIPGAEVSPVLAGLIQFFPLILMGVVFYFFLIRPQRKKDKKVKEMLAALKPGDRVTTIGGIYGTIVSVKDETITLSIGSQRTEMVVTRWAIRQVEEVSVENDGEILA
ncbi:MAG: preprotein translocase subunit YajC [Clostridia bacterium]|nr:preprotein translocase subunit YajC [Clostridia bacterium]